MTNQDQSWNDEAVVQAAAAAALDKKAENPVILSVRDVTSYTDYFLIVSAPSERQTNAIAKNIETEMRTRGILPQHIEGQQKGAWILQDYGDFLVHIFFSGARDYYDLEGCWQQVSRIPIDEAAGQAWLTAHPPQEKVLQENAVYRS
jgi:ribosome-associated protein